MDLILSSYQVNIRKGCAARNMFVVVLYLWDWIPVQDGPSVMSSIVFTGPPTAVLRYDMEGDEYVLSVRLFVTSRNMASNSSLSTSKRSGVSRRAWQATGGPSVVRVCCVLFDGPRGSSFLALSAPGILPGCCLVFASSDDFYTGN